MLDINKKWFLQLSGCENNGYSHTMDTSSTVFQHRMVSHAILHLKKKYSFNFY